MYRQENKAFFSNLSMNRMASMHALELVSRWKTHPGSAYYREQSWVSLWCPLYYSNQIRWQQVEIAPNEHLFTCPQSKHIHKPECNGDLENTLKKLHHEYQHIISSIKPRKKALNLTSTERSAITSLKQRPLTYIYQLIRAVSSVSWLKRNKMKLSWVMWMTVLRAEKYHGWQQKPWRGRWTSHGDML